LSTSPETAASESKDFIDKPFGWLVLAIALTFIPLFGYMLQAGMEWDSIHPAVNAMLNGTCLVFLCVGRLAIAKGRELLHRQCMIAAFASSSVFLASYLTRYAISGTHRYPGDGWPKTLYLIILFSHMLLAMVLVPMVLRTMYLGLKERRAQHRRLARWTWPIWIYVSVTGVLVYLMLYQFA
jgi:putative membrane protein